MSLYSDGLRNLNKYMKIRENLANQLPIDDVFYIVSKILISRVSCTEDASILRSSVEHIKKSYYWIPIKSIEVEIKKKDYLLAAYYIANELSMMLSYEFEKYDVKKITPDNIIEIHRSLEKTKWINYVSFLPNFLTASQDDDSLLMLVGADGFEFCNSDHLVYCIEKALLDRKGELIRLLALQLARYDRHHPLCRQAELYIARSDAMASAGLSDERLNKMTGLEFEELIQQALHRTGIFKRIESTPKSGDYGADLIAICHDETRLAIQCKRSSSKVNLKAVQEISAALSHYMADIGVVVSNNEFLPSAIKLAAANDVELWGADELGNLLAGIINFSATLSEQVQACKS